MNTGTWILGLAIAIGVTLLAAEAMPEVVNALLILILVGIILARWKSIAPLAGLAGRVAGGEGPKKGAK